MITLFKQFLMKESLANFDLSKLVTIIHIDKDNESNWIYTTKEGRKLFLPKEKVGVITLIDDRLANFVNNGHEITKYFEIDGDIIIYSANFAADAIPFRINVDHPEVYLIDRTDGRGWAIPGGFINEGETPEQAALRELNEETKALQKDIKKIEPLENGLPIKTNDPREVDFYSFPFLVHIKKSATLGFGDDAKNGQWKSLAKAKKMKLAFTHHNDFLNKINY